MKVGSTKPKFTTINAGVPQGTLFGPIGFVHHINDLRTTCDHVKYVDDCTIWEICSLSRADSSLPSAADDVAQWTTINKMALSRKKRHISPISINERQIKQVNCTRLLDVTISHDLTRQLHIDEITANASRRLYVIILLTRAEIEPLHLVKIYTTAIRSVIEYACPVCHRSLTKSKQTSLETLRKRS